MKDQYEQEKDKVICKELAELFFNHILSTNDNLVKLLYTHDSGWNNDIFLYVNQVDYNCEYERVKKQNGYYFYSNALFPDDLKAIDSELRSKNNYLSTSSRFVFITSLEKFKKHISDRYSHKESLAKEISKLPNYEELFESHKIEKKAQSKLKQKDRQAKIAINKKATSFNLKEQKALVHRISEIFQKRAKYKDHPLTYFLKLYDDSFMAADIDSSGESLGKFFESQLDDNLREDLIQDLLSDSSYHNPICKRFAMFFDKSNAIIGSLDNNELVRECANFHLRKEEKE